MSAANTDLFKKLTNNFSTTLTGAIVGAGDSSMSLASTTNLPTDTGAVFVIDRVNSSGTATPSVREYVKGTVTGSNVTNLVRGIGGSTAQAHSTGAVVEQVVDQTTINDISSGILNHADQTGALLPAAVNTALAATTGTVLTTPVLQGNIDGWIGANEPWAFASSTTITVPTDATTKYDVGDYIKLTQSATVKYFVITSLTSTVLTVAGLNGVTVANSAITANAYSKTRNPHGTQAVAGSLPFNPYKFKVYRTAAFTPGSSGAFVLMPYDTKQYDTASNVDIVTNKGRFTAPISGFYQINGLVNSGTNAGTFLIIALYKNGSVLQRGSQVQTTAASATTYSDVVQLSAGDYLEMFVFMSSAVAMDVSTGTAPYFSGYLVSAI